VNVEAMLNASGLVMAEIKAAEKEHPSWPEDRVHQAAIVAGEATELFRVAMEGRQGSESIDKIRLQAIQTGATAIRLLMNLPGEVERDGG